MSPQRAGGALRQQQIDFRISGIGGCHGFFFTLASRAATRHLKRVILAAVIKSDSLTAEDTEGHRRGRRGSQSQLPRSRRFCETSESRGCPRSRRFCETWESVRSHLRCSSVTDARLLHSYYFLM